MELTKRIDGYEFNYNDLSLTQNEPYKVLVLDKKTKYKSGLKYAIKNSIDKIEINLNLY